MSRAAGTLVTTHDATYIPPSLMPGYRGYVPTLRYKYGDTYGNSTKKYFQDTRNDVLTCSRSPLCKGGQFPTFYTHQPDLVISNRTRTRDRFLHHPRYQLSNVNWDRKRELETFDKIAQDHRENYVDKTGTIHQVEHFTLPTPNARLYSHNIPLRFTCQTGEARVPFSHHYAQHRDEIAPFMKDRPTTVSFPLPSVQTRVSIHPIDHAPLRCSVDSHLQPQQVPMPSGY